MLRRILISVSLFISLDGPSPAWAVNFFWTGPDLGGPGGNFRTASNWTFTPPPFPLDPAPGGAGDTANFNLGRDPEDRYTVTNVNGENDQMLIHDDSLRLEINDYRLLSEDEESPSFVVGVTSGDVADVRLFGVGAASLRTNVTVIGDGVGSFGDVTVDHLQWVNDGSLNVGGLSQFVGDTGGDGTLTIQNGSLVASDIGAIGRTLGSISEVIVTDSSWMVEGSLLVGGQGIGTLSIRNGGTISSGSGSVLSNSIATVDGVGSSWTISGILSMFAGTGAVLNIQNGGTVTAGLNGMNNMTANSSTEVTLDSGGVLDVRTSINMNTGEFNFLGGTLHIPVFNDNLVNQGGTLSPGNPDQSTGSTNITGNYTHQSAAKLEIEIGGTTAGTQHDFVNIEGTALMAGELELAVINSFEPDLDDEFVVFNTDTLLLGSFSNVADGQRLATTNGLGSFLVHYGPTSTFNANQVVLTDFLPALPGDYNHDGTVDAADYVVWRKTDINGPNGYDTWRTNFGQPSGSGSGVSANATVPEPATFVLLMIAAAGPCLRRRRAASKVPSSR